MLKSFIPNYSDFILLDNENIALTGAFLFPVELVASLVIKNEVFKTVLYNNSMYLYVKENYFEHTFINPTSIAVMSLLQQSVEENHATRIHVVHSKHSITPYLVFHVKNTEEIKKLSQKQQELLLLETEIKQLFDLRQTKQNELRSLEQEISSINSNLFKSLGLQLFQDDE